MGALRYRDWLHLIIAFSAGTVIALAFFDLLPEALRLADPQQTARGILTIAAGGFFAYAIVDRLLLVHDHGAPGTQRGWAGAASLSAHSFMDGLALGIGFQASTRLGIVVAVAILAHDCSDGMNTVSIVLKNRGTTFSAFTWLLVDALAPLAGAAASLFIQPPAGDLAAVLAAFAGFFLYIGACDLLPESFKHGGKIPTTAAFLAGAATLYLVVHFAG